MGGTKKTSTKIKVWVAHRRVNQRFYQQRRSARWLTFSVITTATITALAGIWLAIQIILNPGAFGWLSWVIPGWNATSLLEAPQTLTQIRSAATDAGLTVGNPIYLSTYPGFLPESPGFHDFLLPLYQAQPKCDAAVARADDAANVTTCQQVAELRVYRPRSMGLPGAKPGYRLIDRLTVTEPEELTVIAPLTEAKIAGQGSTRRLALTTIEPVIGKAPLNGAWFHLSGVWQRGRNQVVYGQLLRYDPLRDRLQNLLSWTSLSDQFPRWQQVTGDANPELVVDQTIGLEPHLQVYQFQALSSPGKPIQVKAVSLSETVLSSSTYQNGLLLARNGLWTPALQLLQQSKQKVTDWAATAQAQLDVINLHAQITQTQATQDWANDRQQIIAFLINGQWGKALDRLQSAHKNGSKVRDLLHDLPDRLWQRVETAMRVNPHQTEVQNWGVLLMAVQQTPEAAVAWLQQQIRTGRQSNPTVNSATSIGQQTQQILALLDSPTSPDVIPAPSIAAAPPVEAPVNSNSRIMGVAIPVSTLRANEWWQPDRSMSLSREGDRRWYDVRVLQFEDGQQWQQAPFTELTLTELATGSDTAHQVQALWNTLGLPNNSQIELVGWTGNTSPSLISATVAAMQFSETELHLLVAPENVPQSPATSLFAITLSSLSWLQPSETVTLAALSQDADWATSIAPALWQSLKQTEVALPVAVGDSTSLLQIFGSWSLQLIDLTGDNQPEARLLLQTESSQPISEISHSTPTNSEAHTLIFSKQHGAIYSDWQQEKTIRAIVDLGTGNLPALIVSDAQGYQIQQWSETSQQFE